MTRREDSQPGAIRGEHILLVQTGVDAEGDPRRRIIRMARVLGTPTFERFDVIDDKPTRGRIGRR